MTYILLLLGLLLIGSFVSITLIILVVELISILVEIRSIWNGTWWEKNVTVVEDLIQDKFPIGQEWIFKGKYISHWEIPSFELMSVHCQLDIPFEGGWDWLLTALGNPSIRADYSGTFDLSFRGKIVEKGSFGHMGLCTYRIEVIEILSVARFS